ncbi:MAG: prephenate dehydrogenase/arogenate dehydrogenase family protein, partial [Pseudomonadota bacterium]|nr:prephenate dehydrogenase/arogenate dehydrogenase family protein [Pseudomonadota bacterium]
MKASKEHAKGIDTLSIIGVGLIGGSLAKALKKADFVREVIGFGRSEANLRLALDQGVVDHWTLDLNEAVASADVIMLATPVAAADQLLPRISAVLRDNTIVTDAGSVKGSVIDAAVSAFGGRISHFVPGHPIAGGENSGVGASCVDLFDGQKFILTPLPSTGDRALECIREMWETTGASVSEMDPGSHDRLLALTSHLPHALAFCLVNLLADQSDADECYDLAASGFYDITRIASSDPVMWRDIFLGNQDAVLSRLADYREKLGYLMRLIESKDADGLLAEFRKSNKSRSLIQS